MSGSDQSSMPSQDQQQQQYYGQQDGSQSQMGFLPNYSSNPMSFGSIPSTSQQQQQPQPPASNSSDFSAFSAIHTPIDFGDDMGGGMAMQQNMMMNNSNYLAPPSQQQQRYNPALDFSGQSSGFQSPMYMTTPAMTDGSAGVSGTSTPLAGGENATKQNTSKGSGKPRAPKKPKLKATEGASTQEQDQQSGDANDEDSKDSKAPKKQTKKSKDPNEQPKQTKPRKRKSTGPEAAENASSPAVGTPHSATGENESLSGADGRTATSSRGRGGAGRGRGGRGRGGLSAAHSRRASQADGLSGISGDISMQDDEFSRAGSLAPGTGESTPTKRGAKAGRGVGRGRGGGRRRGTATSRGSRATSGRATASVVPGQENGTVAPDDGILGERIEGDEDGEAAEIDEEDDEDDEEGFDLGLEEDEMDLQEAIQKKRAINMGPLMKAMTEEQQDRYAAFRRHFLDKRFVKRLLQHLTRQTVTPQIVTLVAGVGKVFVGQIVEKAREVRQERLAASANGTSQPSQRQSLRPDHLTEALRRYREEREVPGRFAPGTPNAGAGVSANGKRRRMF